jgi:hypothetical protein
MKNRILSKAIELLAFRGKKEEKNQDYLICIYDCAMLPVTFNIVEFLAVYNYIAMKSKRKFYLVIIDSDLVKETKVRDIDSCLGTASHLYRMRNLLPPLVELFPENAGYSIIKNRQHYQSLIGNKEVFPKKYTPNAYLSNNVDLAEYADAGRGVAKIRSTDYAKRLIKNILGPIEKDLITITLRRSNFDPARNSDLVEIEKFIRFIKSMGLSIVAIPDVDNPKEYAPIKEEDICSALAFNIDLRVATYELAKINFFASNGPAILSSMSASECVTVLMNVYNPNSIVDTPENYKLAKTIPGDPYFWYNKFSRNVVLPDTYENLKTTFLEVLEQIRG